MNTKTLKSKPFAALALILLMVMPMLMAATTFVKADANTPVVSVVLSGTTSTAVLPSVAVGSTFSVDVRVDNTAAVVPGIDSYSYSLTYNALVLKCTANNDPGSYLSNAAPGKISSFTGAPDNVNGVFTAGDIIIDGANPQRCATGNGVLTTVTFQVLSVGQSDLKLQASDVGTPILYYPDATGSPIGVDVNLVNAVYNPMTTSMAVYAHGSTTQSTIQFAPGTNPIGNTFSVDIYMSNMLAEPIWAWNVGVSWNPSVLQLETISEGTYMNGAPGLYDGSATLFIPGYIDNQTGIIRNGISDVSLSNPPAGQTAPAGVLATLTFEVINYANSYIKLTAPQILGPDQTPLGLSDSTNATYVSLPMPAPVAPTAVIHNQGASTYQANSPIVLDATGSQGGSDAIPNPMNQYYPIQTYTWTQISGPAVTGLPLTGNFAQAFQAQLAASSTVNGAIVIQLTVTTAANPADPAYINTGSTTITIAPGIIPPTTDGPQIDLYIVNNVTTTAYPLKDPTSLGSYNTIDQVDSYAPQQVMNLYAHVIFNGAAVDNKLVTFIVNPKNDPSNIIFSSVQSASVNGTYSCVYRLPNTASDVIPFGLYQVNATVEIAQNIKSDAFWFNYGYTLNITSVSVDPNLVARGRDHPTLSVDVTSIACSNQVYYETYAVTDTNGVPIFSSEIGPCGIYGIGTSGVISSRTQTITRTLTIPTYAYVGLATVHVNIFNADPSIPSQYALPYCPEETATFYIGSPS